MENINHNVEDIVHNKNKEEKYKNYKECLEYVASNVITVYYSKGYNYNPLQTLVDKHKPVQWCETKIISLKDIIFNDLDENRMIGKIKMNRECDLIYDIKLKVIDEKNVFKDDEIDIIKTLFISGNVALKNSNIIEESYPIISMSRHYSYFVFIFNKKNTNFRNKDTIILTMMNCQIDTNERSYIAQSFTTNKEDKEINAELNTEHKEHLLEKDYCFNLRDNLLYIKSKQFILPLGRNIKNIFVAVYNTMDNKYIDNKLYCGSIMVNNDALKINKSNQDGQIKFDLMIPGKHIYYTEIKLEFTFSDLLDDEYIRIEYDIEKDFLQICNKIEICPGFIVRNNSIIKQNKKVDTVSAC